MEYSLFMIKPIAYEHKQEILDIIKKKLQIVSTTDVCLSEEFLNKLYASETDEEFRKINSKCLANKKACIGVVRGEIISKIEKTFDLTPIGIIRYLDLQKPIYKKTTNYGHFGKEGLSWEKIIKF